VKRCTVVVVILRKNESETKGKCWKETIFTFNFTHAPHFNKALPFFLKLISRTIEIRAG
jgi:hypothetical protein